jgi:hypothetical protein
VAPQTPRPRPPIAPPSSSPPAKAADLVDLGDLGDLGVVPSSRRDRVPPSAGADRLAETYLAALGGSDGCPRLAMAPSLVPSLPLGQRAAFVLSRIDGESSIEDVLDMSGFPREETLGILYDLLLQGVIEVR